MQLCSAAPISAFRGTSPNFLIRTPTLKDMTGMESLPRFGQSQSWSQMQFTISLSRLMFLLVLGAFPVQFCSKELDFQWWVRIEQWTAILCHSGTPWRPCKMDGKVQSPKRSVTLSVNGVNGVTSCSCGGFQEKLVPNATLATFAFLDTPFDFFRNSWMLFCSKSVTVYKTTSALGLPSSEFQKVSNFEEIRRCLAVWRCC